MPLLVLPVVLEQLVRRIFNESVRCQRQVAQVLLLRRI
jgi:hypothetical protein